MLVLSVSQPVSNQASDMLGDSRGGNQTGGLDPDEIDKSWQAFITLVLPFSFN